MDREKVINAYECVIDRRRIVCECGKCDYHIKDSPVFFCDSQRVLTDALELLKEQSTVEYALNVLRQNGWVERGGTYPKDKYAPVVRCNDCKWRDSAEESPKWLPCINMKTRNDWFCADGEHKEGR